MLILGKKTLTIVISDAAARALGERAGRSDRPAEDLAAQAVEETFAPDWFDGLDDEAKAAITQGVAEADHGDFAADADVEDAFARFKR